MSWFKERALILWYKKSLIVDLYLVVYHRICFSCSPIDYDRFREEWRLQLMRRSSSPIHSQELELEIAAASEQQGLSWWWALRHPIELVKLVERYHMVGRKYVVMFIIHLIVLVHLLIKLFLMSFVFGFSEKTFQLCRSYYYPNLSELLPSPLFFRFFGLLFVSSESFRIIAAYRLVKNCLVNAHGYKIIKMSQINLADISTFNLSVSQWFCLWREFFRRRRKVREKGESMKFSVQAQILNSSMKDLLYHVNTIRHEIYEQLGICKAESRKEIYLKWHCALHGPRVGAGPVFIPLMGFIAMFLAAFVIFLISFTVPYLELLLTFKQSERPETVLQVFSHWPFLLREPARLIRCIETLLFVILQLPYYWEIGAIQVDAVYLISRLYSVIGLIENDLKETRSVECNTEFPSLCRQQNVRINGLYCRTVSRAEKRNLNERFRCYSKLTRLLCLEFQDFKGMYSPLINIQVVLNSLALSYFICLCLLDHSTTEWILLIVGSIAVTVPILSTLASCAFLEEMMKKLHYALLKAMINKNSLLEPEVVQSMQKIGLQLERKEDRAVFILGIYAISPESLVPFFTVLTTAILFLEKYIR